MKKIYLLIYIALLRKKQKCFPWPNSTYSMTTFAKKIRNAIYCYFYVISSFVYIVLTFFSSLTRVSEPVAVACSSLVLFLSCTIFVFVLYYFCWHCCISCWFLVHVLTETFKMFEERQRLWVHTETQCSNK